MTDLEKTLDKLLVAQSEHAAAMYDMGWAVGAGFPKGNRERSLSCASRKLAKAANKMRGELSCPNKK